MVIDVKMSVPLWVWGPVGVLEMFYILIWVVVKHVYVCACVYINTYVCVRVCAHMLKIFF